MMFIQRLLRKKKMEKEIKELNKDLGDLSWSIGVEKNDNPDLLLKYQEVKALVKAKIKELEKV